MRNVRFLSENDVKVDWHSEFYSRDAVSVNMNCPKCGNLSVTVTWVRNETREHSHGVISCVLCGSNGWFTLPPAGPPRTGKGRVVKLPGARRKRGIPGYLPHDRVISGMGKDNEE